MSDDNTDERAEALLSSFERMMTALEEHEDWTERGKLLITVIARFLCQVKEPLRVFGFITRGVTKIMGDPQTAEFCGRPVSELKLTK